MMSQVIRISVETYNRLAKHNIGFDTPSNVIDKLLNYYEGISNPTEDQANTRHKDTTKYIFKNKQYGKGRLVLAVVKTHILDNPTLTYNALLDVFPQNTQGSLGVFIKKAEAQEIYNRTRYKRHFIKEEEIITLSDGPIAVCSEWGSGNIDKFISKAREIGYEILL
jgi:hypothetical protein